MEQVCSIMGRGYAGIEGVRDSDALLDIDENPPKLIYVEHKNPPKLICVQDENYNIIQENAKNCISVISAGGQSLQSIGFFNLPVTFEDQFHILKAFVIPEIKPNLILGFDFRRKFKLCPRYVNSVATTNTINTETANDCNKSFLQCYKNLSESEKQLADNVIKKYEDISSETKG